MCSSCWKLILILSVFIGSAASQTASVHMDDNSDWWSYMKEDTIPNGVTAQEREPSKDNFQIDGISIDSDFSKIELDFGEAIEVARGDAGTSRGQLCYVSPAGDTHLIFEEGEVGFAFYVFENGSGWKGSELCKPSPLVSSGLSTASGLRLGLTPEDVKRILGHPSLETSNKLIYDFEFRYKSSAETLARFRKENPHMSPEEFKQSFEWIDVDAYIEARFASGKLQYLGISRSETY